MSEANNGSKLVKRQVLWGMLDFLVVVFLWYVGVDWYICLGAMLFTIYRRHNTIANSRKKEDLLEQEGYSESPLFAYKQAVQDDHFFDNLVAAAFATRSELKKEERWADAMHLYKEIAPRIQINGQNPLLSGTVGMLAEENERLAFLEFQDGTYKFISLDMISGSNINTLRSLVERRSVEPDWKLGSAKLISGGTWVIVAILVLIISAVIVLGGI